MLKELRAKLLELKNKANGLIQTAKDEKRSMTPEEEKKFDGMMADADKAQDEIRRLEKMQDLDGFLNTPEEPSIGLGLRTKDQGNKEAEYRAAFDAMLRKGANNLSGDEKRALEAGVVAEGGAFVYQEFEKQLVEGMTSAGIMRSLATVITTGGDRNIPVETAIGAAEWVDEEGAKSEATGDTYARITLSAYKLSKLLKVSEELMHDSSFDLAAYLVRNFARAFAEAEESAFISGNGTGKPTGIMANTGIETATASTLAADDLISLFHAVPRQYRNAPGSAFLTSDAVIQMIRKFKDSQNQYLWQPGLQAGQPDRLLNKPIYAVEGVATFADSAKVMVFGDIASYTIADRMTTTVQRLVELYAANGQVGFLGTRRVDGKTVFSPALKTLTVKAA